MEHSLHLYCVLYELPPSHWKLWVSHYHNTNIVSHFAITRLSSSLTHQHIFSWKEMMNFPPSRKIHNSDWILCRVNQLDWFESSLLTLFCNISLPMPQCWNKRAYIWRKQCYERALLRPHHESGLPLCTSFYMFCSLFNQHSALSVCTSTISIAESLANSSLSDCTKLLISRRIALNRNHWSRMENWMSRRSVSPAIGENLAQSCYLISAAIAAMRTVRDISSPTLSYALIDNVCAYLVACGENWKSEFWGFTRMWLKFSWNSDDATRYIYSSLIHHNEMFWRLATMTSSLLIHHRENN